MIVYNVLQKPAFLDIAFTYIVVDILSVISYNIPIASAQEDNTNFLTYTNTNLCFTIKYASD